MTPHRRRSLALGKIAGLCRVFAAGKWFARYRRAQLDRLELPVRFTNVTPVGFSSTIDGSTNRLFLSGEFVEA